MPSQRSINVKQHASALPRASLLTGHRALDTHRKPAGFYHQLQLRKSANGNSLLTMSWTAIAKVSLVSASYKVKAKCSPYSITERRVPELIPVLRSQPAGDVSHKPGGRLPLFSARPTVTPATLKRAATNFAAW